MTPEEADPEPLRPVPIPSPAPDPADPDPLARPEAPISGWTASLPSPSAKLPAPVRLAVTATLLDDGRISSATIPASLDPSVLAAVNPTVMAPGVTVALVALPQTGVLPAASAATPSRMVVFEAAVCFAPRPSIAITSTQEPVVVVVMATVSAVPLLAELVALAAPDWLDAHPSRTRATRSIAVPVEATSAEASVALTVMDPGADV